MADHDAAAIQAVTALQFGGPWDPWGLTPDEARTVIAAAMPHIRAQIASDIEAYAARASQAKRNGLRVAVQIARGDAK